jgi:hypothetical protein
MHPTYTNRYLGIKILQARTKSRSRTREVFPALLLWKENVVFWKGDLISEQTKPYPWLCYMSAPILLALIAEARYRQTLNSPIFRSTRQIFSSRPASRATFSLYNAYQGRMLSS